MKRLVISIAVHNNLLLTQKCVDSIYKYTPAEAFFLYVTDNASTDGTYEYLKALVVRRGNASVSRNQENLGYSEPHRAVFKAANFEPDDLFCVLNNDLEVCPGWFETMTKALDEKDVAIVGIRGSCCAITAEGLGTPSNDEPEYVEGSCMVIRPEAVKGLPGGLFDPIFRFAYYEDSDLSLRVRKHGWKIAHVDLPIVHQGAATSRIVERTMDLEGYKIRNKTIFMDRWGKYLSARLEKRVKTDRLVIRRAGAQGDVIMTTPAVRALRKKFPGAVIVISTACPDVYANNPDVNQVTLQGAPFKPTDLVFNLDMAYEKLPLVHPIKAYADALEVELDDWKPVVYPNDTARIVAENRMPAGAKYAIVHPGMINGWVGRQWKADNFHQVVVGLRKMGYKTVVVGSEGTPTIAADLDYRNVAFSHFVALMERASLFVGLDSMPIHVAQACGIPTVGIFGCVHPELRLVPGSRSIGVTAKHIGCLGCHHWLPGPRTATISCLRGRERCMDELSVESVLAAADAVAKL